ncbi:MAG: C4-dicarboxylate ABC transporter [Rhodobacteraceae bacterium]|nr:MAG: C4-dicarboxylate ABC transporter [Paracoccaceae bacterium]
MERRMKKSIISVLVATGLLAGAASAEPVTLKFAHGWPTGAGPHADFALDWTKQVTECTKGDVQFEFHTGGSQLGNFGKLEEYLRAGLIDVAHGLNHFPRNRFNASTVIDTPLLAKSAHANSNTLWTLFEEGLISESYDGMKVLALHAHNAGMIHTNGKAVRLPTDVAGLRIRTPSPAAAIMITALGGIPVGVPPTETYEVLSKGTADGTVFPWEAVSGFKLAEVLENHTDAGIYTTSFWFGMNEKSYKSLSAEAQTCVDAASNRTLVNKMGDYWNKWDAPGKAQAIEAGNNIIVLTDAEKAVWTETMTPVIATYHDSLRGDGGVKNVDEIYARAQELVVKYQAEADAKH